MMDRHRAEATLISWCARVLSGATVIPSDVPLPEEPSVFFANHSSHLDAILLWSTLPPDVRTRTRPVAARDYWEQGRIRRHLASDVFHVVLVDRGRTGTDAAAKRSPTHSLDAMISALDEGASLILFPEGSRFAGDEIGAFKSGLYHLARHRPATSLVPVYLENLSRILPKGDWLPVPLLGSIRFGSPFRISEGEDKAAFLQRARDAINELRGT